jgi:hypothetical protein
MGIAAIYPASDAHLVQHLVHLVGTQPCAEWRNPFAPLAKVLAFALF